MLELDNITGMLLHIFIYKKKKTFTYIDFFVENKAQNK